MRPADFAVVASLVRSRSGLVLAPDKSYLVESRLLPLARRRNLNGIAGLVERLRGADGAEIAAEVVEAMTTNESFFFRDGKPFEHLRLKALPTLHAARPPGQPLRIWSAACSSGQEPYTIAMVLAELAPQLAGRPVEILATDIAREMLARTEAGLYTQFEVQRGLPVQKLIKWFRKEGEQWRASEALRAMVRVRAFNLLDDPASLGRFDIVFCRNVLLYFDQPTKGRVLDAIARQMAPGGFLYLGGAETVLGLTERFVPAPGETGVYTPAIARAAAAGAGVAAVGAASAPTRSAMSSPLLSTAFSGGSRRT